MTASEARLPTVRRPSDNGKRARTAEWQRAVDAAPPIAAQAEEDRMPRSDTRQSRQSVTIVDAPPPKRPAHARLVSALRSIRHAVIPSSMADESSDTDNRTSTSSRRPAGSIFRKARRTLRSSKHGSEPARGAATVEFEEDVGRVDCVVVDSPFDVLVAPESVVEIAETEGGKMSHAKSVKSGSQLEAASKGLQQTHSMVGSSSAVMRESVMPIAYFIRHFFDSSFADPDKEMAFRREEWHTRKAVAVVSAVFYLGIWATLMGFMPHPIPAYNIGATAVATGVLAVAVFVLVALDCPLRAPRIWQVVLLLASYWLPLTIHIDLWECGFVTTTPTCGAGRNFISSQFYAIAQPAIALLCFYQHRAFALVGAVAWIAFVAAAIVPQNSAFARNLINFVLLITMLIWISYLAEKAQRRIFTLRDQLKTQFKATQRAQASERVASEAKRRFLAYIFHEIRGPTNAAMLALANLEGEAAFENLGPAESEMVQGITSSLVMMERVLNSVLDHSRMESGKFVLQSAPFDFSHVFRTLLLSHRGAAQAKAIELQLDFDDAINRFSPNYIGDETRIYQVLSNLVSNAIKFTPPNESKAVTLSAKLLHPTLDTTPTISVASEKVHTVAQLDSDETRRQLDTAVIRVEVRDGGVGIRPRDVQDGLFDAYAQTAVGLRQGGKGSGLGLALVKQIVKLAGGRLGVQSQVNVGSVFWIELPLRRPRIDTPTTDDENAGLLQSLSPLPQVHEEHATSTAMMPSLTPRKRPDLSVAQLEPHPTVSGLELFELPPLTPENEDEPELTALNILVADDDPLTRKLMARMLERLGHTVSSACDGGEALDLVRKGWTGGEQSPYDLLFLDNQMPVLSGIDVVREMRRIGLSTFVCGVTGNALLEDQEDYIAAGLNRMLVKPVLERNIRDAIEAARQHRRLQRPPPPNARMQSFGAASSQLHSSEGR